MIGSGYWSTGIVIEKLGINEWKVWLDFQDSGFCEIKSTEGTLRARYIGPLDELVDTLKIDAERLGIIWSSAGPFVPTVYYDGDGELPNSPPDAREQADAQAKRLGWVPIYERLSAPTQT